MSYTTLYSQFHTEKKQALQKEMGLKNIFMVPTIEKIVVSMGVGSLVTRKGSVDLSSLESNLAMITGQKSTIVYSKKAVSNFKLRVGQPVMLLTTLRKKKAFDFLERLSKVTLPRLRDFSGLSPKKFDTSGNYNFGMPTQSVFAELLPDDIVMSQGVQITIVTTATNPHDAKILLSNLGLLFVS